MDEKSVPPPPAAPPAAPAPRDRRLLALVALFAIAALATLGVTALLVTIFQHKVEARVPFVRTIEVDEVTTDPAPWGLNWPHQYDAYLLTADNEGDGGSSMMPESKLEIFPWLRRLYAGYAFSIDYREARGHAYMLYDQQVTERVTKRQQAGACMHCHASIIPTYRRLGLEDMGKPADENVLASRFDWPAVMRGFELASRKPYQEMSAEVYKTPDALPATRARMTALRGEAPDDALHAEAGRAHPVSCVDCHEPQTMKIRVTRPGFVLGIAALAESAAPVPHLPSVERWRQGDRKTPYDPNLLASRQEMRSFVCGQCHVEYYCADKMTLTFPWGKGLKVEQIEKTWEETVFPSGEAFYDFKHGETGAPIFKAQHPEFELWSQGIHARNGVSCADCHMPYQRKGAMKISSHTVRSPLRNVAASCQPCHNVSEAQLLENVLTIQNRTKAMMARAASAMTDMLDAILEAQAAGVTNEQLADIFVLQRQAMWRLDFISSENSDGFHASQEAVRILGESIDYSRQAQAMALRLRAPAAPAVDQPGVPIQGVTPGR